METRITRPGNASDLELHVKPILEFSRHAQSASEQAESPICQAIEAVLERLLAPAAELEVLRRKKILTCEEVEQLYNIKTGTLRNMRTQGRGPRYIMYGSKVLYRHQDIENYLETRTYPTTG